MNVLKKEDVDALYANLKKRLLEDLDSIIALAKKVIHRAEIVKIDIEQDRVFITSYNELTQLVDRMLSIMHTINLNTIMTKQNIIYLLGKEEFKKKFEAKDND